MRLCNLAIKSISPGHHRKYMWQRGLLLFVRHAELGMQHLLFESAFIDLSRIPLPDAAQLSFDEIQGYCDVSRQLIQLVEAGVPGPELSFKVRERFSKSQAIPS
jgi:hypothetical protein